MVSKEEMKEEIQKAVTAALEQVASSSTAAGRAVRKAKAKAKVTYDETRRCGQDERDQPHSKPWRKSLACGTEAQLRSCHNSTSSDDTYEALSRLRTGGWQENDVTATEVKAMITVVSKEYQLIKAKDHGKALAKKKAAPVEETVSSPGTLW